VIEESTSPGAETPVDAPSLPPTRIITSAVIATAMMTVTPTTTTTMTKITTPTTTPSTIPHLQHTCGMSRRKSVSGEAGRESESLLLAGRNRSPEPLPREMVTTRYDFVPPVVEESDSVILEETEIAKHVCHVRRRSRDERRAKLSTPPPTKNVSFGELHEQSYIEQVIMPFPLHYMSNHRHAGKGAPFAVYRFLSAFGLSYGRNVA